MNPNFDFTEEELAEARKFDKRISIKIENNAIAIMPKEPYCKVIFSVCYMGDCRLIKTEVSSGGQKLPSQQETAVYDCPLKDVLSRFVDYLSGLYERTARKGTITTGRGMLPPPL